MRDSRHDARVWIDAGHHTRHQRGGRCARQVAGRDRKVDIKPFAIQGLPYRRSRHSW
ncbi:hypothetical protein ACLK15_05255 [Escherichia coli]